MREILFVHLLMNSMAHNPHVSPHTKFKDAPILYPGNSPPPLSSYPGYTTWIPVHQASLRLLPAICLCTPSDYKIATPPLLSFYPSILLPPPPWLRPLPPPGSLFSLFPAPSHMGRVSCRSLLTRAPWRGWQT